MLQGVREPLQNYRQMLESCCCQGSQGPLGLTVPCTICADQMVMCPMVVAKEKSGVYALVYMHIVWLHDLGLYDVN